jgi:hypothetical protein
MKSRGQGYRRKSILSACQAHNYTFKLDKERPLPFAGDGEKKRSVPPTDEREQPAAHNKIISIITHLDSAVCIFVYATTVGGKSSREIDKSDSAYAFSNLISLCVSETQRHVQVLKNLKGVVRRRILFIFHLGASDVQITRRDAIRHARTRISDGLCVSRRAGRDSRAQLCAARGPHRRRISFFALGRCQKL